MECRSAAVSFLSWALVVSGAAFLLRQTRRCGQYGRYAEPGGRCWPAGPAWFLQEVPAFLVPLLLLVGFGEPGAATGRSLLVWTFMLHYFYRSEGPNRDGWEVLERFGVFWVI
ncbi:3-oxo-5-alpha-steroid 4-dehydrogenase 2-like [Poecilia latipinna]|uniref:3-oxo-5-alpha-steroid 4-dehydrogenase 2-like n=1 Tax=Poecilia latipinna TaxID=48699 RepID=UPI00072EDD06|nr:PREDICTED: 3-oxo-5-alpha-steroid 4-dehydrogenase 2-like [Poecilia latipinna]